MGYNAIDFTLQHSHFLHPLLGKWSVESGYQLQSPGNVATQFLFSVCLVNLSTGHFLGFSLLEFCFYTTQSMAVLMSAWPLYDSAS